MSAVTRRGLLAFGASLSTGWFSVAFAADPPARQVELFATWHAARRAQVPLLAIVVPEPFYRRGRVVGAVLGEASPSLLELLAAYAPVCASREDLHLLGVRVPESAWFVVIRTDSVPAEVLPIDGPPESDRPFEDDIDPAAKRLKDALAAITPARGTVKHARSTWQESRIPGSYWASAWGCGLTIEGREEMDYGVLCGMGSVPHRAARFLIVLNEEGP